MVISELEIGINLVGIDEAIEKMQKLNAEIEKNISLKKEGNSIPDAYIANLLKEEYILPTSELLESKNDNININLNIVVDGFGESVIEKVGKAIGKRNSIMGS